MLIQYQRVFMANSTNFPKLHTPNQEFVCDRLFEKTLQIHNSTKFQPHLPNYTVLNEYISSFLDSKQNFAVFRKLVERSNQDDRASLREQAVF